MGEQCRHVGAVAAVLLCAGAGSAETLSGALRHTYDTSPQLTSARAQLRALDEGVPIAKSDARLKVSGTVGVTQSSDGITQLANGARILTGGLNLSYPLFQGGRVKNAIHAAEARDIAGRADLRLTEGNLFTQAVGAYMDVIRYAQIVELNIKNVRVLETNFRASRDRFQVGDLTRTDVAQSEARLSIARSQLLTAQGNLTAAREDYRRVVGEWPVDLQAPPALPPLPRTADDAVKLALDNAPSLASTTASSQAAGYDVRSANALRLPTFSAIGGSSYSDYLGTRARAAGLPDSTPGIGQTVGQNTVGLQLTMPLYQGGSASAKIRQAQALESQALEQAVDVERQVIANTRSAYALFAAATAAIAANEQAVKANELALEGVRQENKVGTRTVLDVLNAEQELLNAQTLLVTARRDQYVAGFALLNAMGQAEARDLGLEGGALYDPLANYNRVRNRFGDWSDDGPPKAHATRTTGATPLNPDTQPLPPDPDIGEVPFGKTLSGTTPR